MKLKDNLYQKNIFVYFLYLSITAQEFLVISASELD